MERIRVGVSHCLLGGAVRYDGGHRRHEIVCSVLARLFELVPVCPEVSAGLGVPRPPVRLVDGGSGNIRVLGAEDGGLDVTEVLAGRSLELVFTLAGVCGFVLKSRSPSCGAAGVPVFRRDGSDAGFAGSGVFARCLRQAYPGMPLIEEFELGDAARLADFVYLVRDYHGKRRRAVDNHAPSPPTGKGQ